jgi:prevent-host-death family protein
MVIDHGINHIMKEIAISVFKAKCLGILEEVRKTRKPIRITRFGKPVAEVVPSSPATPRRLGDPWSEPAKSWETSLAPPAVGTIGKRPDEAAT